MCWGILYRTSRASGKKVVVLLVVDVGLWGNVCCGGGMVGRAGVLKSSLSLVSSSLCS